MDNRSLLSHQSEWGGVEKQQQQELNLNAEEAQLERDADIVDQIRNGKFGALRSQQHDFKGQNNLPQFVLDCTRVLKSKKGPAICFSIMVLIVGIALFASVKPTPVIFRNVSVSSDKYVFLR